MAVVIEIKGDEDEEAIPPPKWKICCRKCFLTRRCMRHNFVSFEAVPLEKLFIGFLCYSMASSGFLIYAFVTFDDTMKSLTVEEHTLERTKELLHLIEDIIFANIFCLIWAYTICVFSFLTLSVNYFNMPNRNFDVAYWCCISCTFTFCSFLSWFIVPNILHLYKFLHLTYEFPEKDKLNHQIFLIFVGLALNVTFILMGVLLVILIVATAFVAFGFLIKLIYDCFR